MTTEGVHSCPLPKASRKYRHSLYVCDCGQAWRSVFWENYAGTGYDWEAWPLVTSA